MMMGKSLTEHITDLVTQSLSEGEIDLKSDNYHSSFKINELFLKQFTHNEFLKFCHNNKFVKFDY